MPRPGRSLTRRSGSQVFPLELFFDLVFVLAVTQCTSIMSADPTWAGMGRGLLALAVLWWAWTAYAWLTSVIDPEQDATRVTMFAAMGAMLVVSVCVPQAFGALALTFAVAYGVVRAVQIVLFALASPGDRDLRRSVAILASSTAFAVGLLVGAAFVDPPLREAMWVLAVLFDLGGPFLFGSAGWRLVPGHFAERHAAVVIIALGESIVAIGVGAARTDVSPQVIAAAVLGVFLSAALWWLHFDVVALATERHLGAMEPGRAQNELARDAYSYLHLPMVAGIVLMALGMTTAIAHLDRPLHLTIAAALAGGVTSFLWGHVAFRWRFAGSINRERLATGALLVVLIPFAPSVPAWVALVAVAVITWALVTYETTAWSDTRAFIRRDHGLPSTDGTMSSTTEETPD
ncbi:MAG: low temperature requirement protein A [Actinobacteria bacterium]|nr:low temperature requirement protein A [Actinomycetota bacterium]